MRNLLLLLTLGLALHGSALAQDETIAVEFLVPEVISERPHATDAFTQGLLLHDGLLYESTGRYGQSTVRAVEPETGEVLRRFDLPAEFFAEGLALVEDRLYQITWREQAAIIYELQTGIEDDTFEPLGALQYSGEGWGLCYDGELLYMSNGSDVITARDPETFAPVEQVRVELPGSIPIDQINELECVGDDIWANVWQTDAILRIDKATGQVTGLVDATGLLDEATQATLEGGAVLNGIAYDAENDVFLITGKLWPTLFEVRFVPADS